MAEIAERLETFADRARRVAGRVFRHENGILIMVLISLIGVMAVVTHGLSIRIDNVLNLLLQSSLRGVISIGQAFVILAAGIDLSVSGIALFSAFIFCASVTLTPAHSIVSTPLPIYGGAAVMLLAGAGVGVLNGSLVSRIGMPALIVTLGMWQITNGVTYQLSGGEQIRDLPEAIGFLGSGRVAGIPIPFAIFIAVGVVAYLVLTYTKFGRHIYAVGGNPVSAWLCGVNVKRVKLYVFVISGLCAALGGMLYTVRVKSFSTLSLTGLELDSIGSVAVGGVSLFGGRGTMIGAIIGVFIISVINNAMSILKADPMLEGIVKGVIIFTAVAIDCIRRRR